MIIAATVAFAVAASLAAVMTTLTLAATPPLRLDNLTLCSPIGQI